MFLCYTVLFNMAETLKNILRGIFQFFFNIAKISISNQYRKSKYRNRAQKYQYRKKEYRKIKLDIKIEKIIDIDLIIIPGC